MATKKKRLPLHKRLANQIEKFGLSKSKIAKELKISRPTFYKYLEKGKIGDVGNNRFNIVGHDIEAWQKAIIRTKYLQK